MGEPQDRFTANFKFQYVHNENDGAIAQADIFCGANGRADEIYLLQGAVAIPAGYDCKLNNGRYFLPDVAPPLARLVPTPSRAAGFRAPNSRPAGTRSACRAATTSSSTRTAAVRFMSKPASNSDELWLSQNDRPWSIGLY